MVYKSLQIVLENNFRKCIRLIPSGGQYIVTDTELVDLKRFFMVHGDGM